MADDEDTEDANVKVVAPDDDLRLRQDSRSSMVCREILQPALFEAVMKHSNVNSLA